MNKVGLLIVGGSILGAGLLFVIWLVGFLVQIGGALIHLALLLAIVVGLGGGIVGLVVMLVGKKSQP